MLIPREPRNLGRAEPRGAKARGARNSHVPAAQRNQAAKNKGGRRGKPKTNQQETSPQEDGQRKYLDQLNKQAEIAMRVLAREKAELEVMQEQVIGSRSSEGKRKVFDKSQIPGLSPNIDRNPPASRFDDNIEVPAYRGNDDLSKIIEKRELEDDFNLEPARSPGIDSPIHSPLPVYATPKQAARNPVSQQAPAVDPNDPSVAKRNLFQPNRELRDEDLPPSVQKRMEILSTMRENKRRQMSHNSFWSVENDPRITSPQKLHQKKADYYKKGGFLSAMRDLQGGPSEEQRRMAEVQRQKLLQDLDEQVRVKREEKRSAHIQRQLQEEQAERKALRAVNRSNIVQQPSPSHDPNGYQNMQQQQPNQQAHNHVMSPIRERENTPPPLRQLQPIQEAPQQQQQHHQPHHAMGQHPQQIIQHVSPVRQPHVMQQHPPQVIQHVSSVLAQQQHEQVLQSHAMQNHQRVMPQHQGQPSMQQQHVQPVQHQYVVQQSPHAQGGVMRSPQPMPYSNPAALRAHRKSEDLSQGALGAVAQPNGNNINASPFSAAQRYVKAGAPGSDAISALLSDIKQEQQMLRQQFQEQMQAVSKLEEGARGAAREHEQAIRELRNVKDNMYVDSLDEFSVATNYVPKAVAEIPDELRLKEVEIRLATAKPRESFGDALNGFLITRESVYLNQEENEEPTLSPSRVPYPQNDNKHENRGSINFPVQKGNNYQEEENLDLDLDLDLPLKVKPKPAPPKPRRKRRPKQNNQPPAAMRWRM